MWEKVGQFVQSLVKSLFSGVNIAGREWKRDERINNKTVQKNIGGNAVNVTEIRIAKK